METVSGTFDRKPPTEFSPNGNLPLGWFVLSYRWFSDKKLRREVHAKWYKISHGERKIFRIIRFSTSLKGSQSKGSGEIVLDWQGWLELNGHEEDVDKSLELTISPVRWWHLVFLPFSNPDPTVQLSGKLGMISLALGILSLLLGILSVILTVI